MKQETRKKFARGMVISGLLAIALSGAGSFINRIEIDKSYRQKSRLLEYNKEIYSISLDNPSVYNENVAKIRDIGEKIRDYEETCKYSSLFLAGSIAVAGGAVIYPSGKKNSKANL